MKKERHTESFMKEAKFIKLRQLFLNLMGQEMKSFLVLTECTQVGSLSQDHLETSRPNFKNMGVMIE